MTKYDWVAFSDSAWFSLLLLVVSVVLLLVLSGIQCPDPRVLP